MQSYSNRTVAVVGASGFIGMHLTSALRDAGARVIAVSRSGVVLPPRAGVGKVESLRLNIEDAPGLNAAFKAYRPSVVFHLASRPDGPESLIHMRGCLKLNTESVLNVLDAATAGGAEMFVFGDSSKDYGNTNMAYSADVPERPVCSYAITKAAAWRLCITWSAMAGAPRVAALRPTLVFGPGQGRNLIGYLVSQLRAGLIPVQGGEQTRDPLYIDDAIAAYLRVGLSERAAGHAIPIGGGHEMTVREICHKVLAAYGSSAELHFDDTSLRLTEIFRSRCDNSGASQLLGWRPQVTFEEGLARLVAETPGILKKRMAIA